MKVHLQFTVNCSQCPRNDVFNTLALFQNSLGNTWWDAEAYFEKRGWLHLPSGSWVCRIEHQAKEAA